ncbi:MAG: STAS-like domain-containing protein [Muribaculaceae bacterium]|nr:STAS-like domain-containing protein [Muribaculaceae bacterium]
MNKILVKDLLKGGSYPDGGAELYNLAYPIISNNQIVNIDLTDVDSVPTLFMNMSFGKLISDFGKIKVMKSLKFFNITKSQLERIKKYFSNFK